MQGVPVARLSQGPAPTGAGDCDLRAPGSLGDERGETGRAGVSACFSPDELLEPPNTNRGVRLTSGIDFLVGTCRGSTVQHVKDTLSGFFDGAEYVDRDSGGNFYRCRAEGMYGSKVYWTEGRDDICVWLPGRACAHLGYVNLLCLTTLLGLALSRFDWKLDHCPFSVERVRDAWRHGQANSKVPRDSWTYLENAQGKTFYIGAKASDRRLVCYDMRGFTRLELRTKGEKAQVVLEALYGAETEEDANRVMMGFITGYVDFVERTGLDSNATRDTGPRLGWWESFVGAVEKIRFAARTSAVDIADRLRGVVVDRGAATFAAYVEVLYGWGWSYEEAIRHIWRMGRGRMKSRHWALVAQCGPKPDLVPF